jgi:hypothetical protein
MSMTDNDRTALARYPGARWRDADPDDGETRGWVCIDITLRRKSDGIERVHVDGIGFPVETGDDTRAAIAAAHYWWTEGNGGCDCNRRMDFARAGGEEPELDSCSTGELVIVAPAWLADRYAGELEE